MFFKPPPEPPVIRGRDSSGDPPAEGIVARVRAASAQRGPDLGNRRVVMLVLGAVVFGAVILQFSTGSRGGRTPPSAGEPVLPPPRPEPGDAAAGGGRPRFGSPPPAARTAPAEQFTFALEAGGPAPLRVTVPSAVALIQGAEGAEARRLRAAALRGLLEAARAGLPGPALEGAEWLLGDADALDATLLGGLAEAALAALAQDDAVFGALRVLARIPAADGLLLRAALDRVILDEHRPLAVRVEAARARPSEGRPEALAALAADPSVHPALREALAGR